MSETLRGQLLVAAPILHDPNFHRTVVLVAEHGEEAFALAAKHHVDVLLSDLMLPKLGGHEVADRLRSSQPHLKVLYMSGYAESGLFSDGVLPPGTAFLEKPFTFSELTGKVQGLLS